MNLLITVAFAAPERHQTWIKYKPILQEYLRSWSHLGAPKELKAHSIHLTPEHANIAIQVADIIEVGRWGSLQDYNSKIKHLIAYLGDGTKTERVDVVFSQIPYLVRGISTEHQQCIIEQVLSWCSNYLVVAPTKDNDNIPLSVISAFFHFLFVTYPAEKILQLATVWTEGESLYFATTLSDIIYTASLSSKLDLFENAYYIYLAKLAEREVPIPIINFQMHCDIVSKRGRIDIDKQIALVYYQKFHDHLRNELADVNELDENHIDRLWHFVTIIYSHLIVYYTTVYQSSEANTAAIPIYDENCMALLDIIYEWNLALQMRLAKDKRKDIEFIKAIFVRSQLELILQYRRLTTTETEYQLLLCHHNLKYTMTSYGCEFYNELYTGVVATLHDLLGNVSSVCEMFFAVQIFEELFLIEKGKINIAKSKITFANLLSHALNNPAFSKILFTHKTFVFIMAHLVSFKKETLQGLGPENIWTACQQVIERLAQKKLTANKLPLDVLVPSGMKENFLDESFVKMKLETFATSPDRYMQLWWALFMFPPQCDYVKFDDDYITAMDRMIIATNQLKQYGQNVQVNWRRVTAQILARGNLHMFARENKPQDALRRQMTLYNKAITYGYYDESLELIFFSLSSWALEWIDDWEKIPDIAVFKKAFLEFLGILAEKSWPEQGAKDRERSFLDVLEGIMAKDPSHGHEYVLQLCTYWKAIIKTVLPPFLTQRRPLKK